MKEQCEKYNITYYETAHNREQVIRKLIEERVDGEI